MSYLLSGAALRSHSLLDELPAHVMLLVSSSLRAQEVGEKEELQDAEDNEELQQDEQPQRTPPRHLTEAFRVESHDRFDAVNDGHTHAVYTSLIQYGLKNTPKNKKPGRNIQAFYSFFL